MKTEHAIVAIMFLVIAACASEPAPAPQTASAVGGSCPADDHKIVWAEESFDKARSAALLAELEQAARADREAISQGAMDKLGREAGEVVRKYGDGKFVSYEAAELTIRLRQLECATARGVFRNKPDTAAKMMDKLIGEISAARAKVA
jgi:hypothetical protein